MQDPISRLHCLLWNWLLSIDDAVLYKISDFLWIFVNFADLPVICMFMKLLSVRMHFLPACLFLPDSILIFILYTSNYSVACVLCILLCIWLQVLLQVVDIVILLQ